MMLECDFKCAIESIPCLCWGILVVVLLYISSKYILLPRINNRHERKMIAIKFQNEKEWAGFEKTKASSDESLHQQISELKKNCSELKISNEMLKKQLAAYEELFNKLNCEITPKSK